MHTFMRLAWFMCINVLHAVFLQNIIVTNNASECIYYKYQRRMIIE